jgi:hypothetical protein
MPLNSFADNFSGARFFGLYSILYMFLAFAFAVQDRGHGPPEELRFGFQAYCLQDHFLLIILDGYK